MRDGIHINCQTQGRQYFLNVISGFHRQVDELCILLEYYAAYGGNSLPTFRDKPTSPILKGQEN